LVSEGLRLSGRFDSVVKEVCQKIQETQEQGVECFI